MQKLGLAQNWKYGTIGKSLLLEITEDMEIDVGNWSGRYSQNAIENYGKANYDCWV